MTMQEGTVVQWPVQIGQHVERGQLVLIIESEKAEVEIEAAGSGTLRHIYVESDETVPCGTLLAVLTAESDEPFDQEAFKARYEAEQGGSPSAAQRVPTPLPPRAPGAPAARTGKAPVTPAARKLAKNLGLDPADVAGTGPGGRVTRERVLRSMSWPQAVVIRCCCCPVSEPMFPSSRDRSRPSRRDTPCGESTLAVLLFRTHRKPRSTKSQPSLRMSPR